MLSFDLVLIAALGLAVALVLFRREPLAGRERYLPWAALAIATVHFLLLRRPSFFPAYGVAVALAFTIRRATYVSRILRLAMGTASLLALVAVAGLAWAFPIIRLPAPTGPYRVGSRWLPVVDSTRTEDFVRDSAVKRALLLRIWYPADTTAPSVAPLMHEVQAQSLAKGVSLPAFAFSHLPRTATHTFADVALSDRESTWPVVLFSHGFGIGYESQNTVQMEELASHGYVVVSIDHPYEAGAVAFPGGPVIRMAPAQSFDTTAAQRLVPLISALAKEQDTVTLKQATAEMRDIMQLGPSMTRWLADTRFVADLLAQWQRAAPLPGFAGRLRTDRLGVFGMSFGGATAASFCAVDARCAAGINLDGLGFGPSVDTAIARPFLFATSQGNAHMYDTEFLRATAPVRLITVAGALYLDYTDFGYISPLFVKLGALGGISPFRMREIMNSAVLGMMNAYLTERAPFQDSTLTRFPEVSFRSRPGVSPPPA